MRIGSALSALAAIGLLACVPPASAQVAITGARPAPPKPAPGAPAPAPAPADAPAAAARRGGDSDTLLADVAQTYRHAVGAVVLVRPGKAPRPFGTAWAFDTNLFATNGHIVAAIARYLAEDKDSSFYIAINQTTDKRLKVVGASAHKNYPKEEVRYDGRVAVGPTDIAVLRTADPAPAHFSLASKADLEALRSGTRIAFLGFPTEFLSGGNVDAQLPIATMQSGIVVAVSDRFLADSGFDKNRLIRHSLPATGGASGSPIFTADGKVVAILWGGNVLPGAEGVIRQANAAQINFAERIDSLAEVPRP